MSNVGFRCGERDPRCWSSWFVVVMKLSMLGRRGRWVFRRWSWWRCRCWLESVVHPVVTWRRYVVLPVCAVLAWAHCLSPFWLEFTVRRSSSCCRGGRGAGTLCFPYVPSWRGFVACPRAARLALVHCSTFVQLLPWWPWRRYAVLPVCAVLAWVRCLSTCCPFGFRALFVQLLPWWPSFYTKMLVFSFWEAGLLLPNYGNSGGILIGNVSVSCEANT